MPGEPAPALLRGVDVAAFAVALAVRLRARGVAVGLSAIEDFTTALKPGALDQNPGRPDVHALNSRSQLYWRARITLVRRHPDLAVFDQVFAAVFDAAGLEMDPHARRSPLSNAFAEEDRHAAVRGNAAGEQAGAGLPWMTLPPVVAESDDEAPEPLTVPQRLPNHLAAAADLPFEQLSESEMRQLGSWLEAAVWPTRRSRRTAVDRRGRQIALRPTIARARRTGWEPVKLVRVRPVQRSRRVVMLCDVSQSMQAQSVAYLHLMRGLVLAADAEVFAFATSLTRLTTVLAHRSASVALERAAERVTDRFGGTRIATNLQALLGSEHRNVLRGAVVIIASDGWDSDPAPRMAAAMARLRRRAHRVIWINPRASAAGYEPRVAGLAAALIYCHDFLPAHSFASLAQVVARLSSTESRGPRAGTGRR